MALHRAAVAGGKRFPVESPDLCWGYREGWLSG